jgi:hypothetical protein
MPAIAMGVALAMTSSCSSRSSRGIADKRSDFKAFLPMREDPYRSGLKPVKPFFKRGNREEVLRAIERACTPGKEGASIYEPRTGEGYYVNCNPRNRQLLNGYIPSDPRRRPHSRP